MNPDEPSLLQRWVHSHEEDGEGLQIFRPEGFRFPPSRGRRSFELQPEGKARVSGPGPVDLARGSEATWTLDEQGRLSLGVAGSAPVTLEVVEVEPDRLVVRKPGT